MADITKNQHYIPRFALRFFEIEKGNCFVYNKKRNSVSQRGSRSIMVLDYLYEIEHNDVFIRVNYLEKYYASYDDNLSHVLRNIITIITTKNYKFFESDRWIHMQFELIIYVVQLMLRHPSIKTLIYGDSMSIMSNALYLLFTKGLPDAVVFAKETLTGSSLELVLTLFREIQDDNTEPFEDLYSHFFCNYFVMFFVIPDDVDSHFYLGDQPIIIQQFIDADYVLPISPKICIGLYKVDIKTVKNSIVIKHITETEVTRVNEIIINQSDEIVVVQDKNLTF